MRVRRTWRAVVPGLALLLTPVATPAHAANYTAVYNTGTGFGTQVLSANIGDTITITNASATAVVLVHVGVCAQSHVAGPGVSVTFTMCANVCVIVAVGAGVQPVLVVA